MKSQIKSRNLPCWMLSCAILLSCAGASSARWTIITEPVPTERLIANVSEYIRQNPRDAHSYYVLGRVHSLAFAQGGNQVDVIPVGSVNNQDKNLPSFAGYQTVRVTRDTTTKAVDAAAIMHLQKSVLNYTLAAQRDEQNALYFLGLGWMLEQGAPLAAQAGTPWPQLSKKYPPKSNAHLKKQIALLGSTSKSKRGAAYLELQKKIEQASPLLAQAATDPKQKPVARELTASLLTALWQQKSLVVAQRGEC